MLNGINALFALIANSIFDIKDAVNAKGTMNIKSNVIELVCVYTEDISDDVISDYAKSLEIVYATFIRSILQTVIRNRGNSSAKHLFKSLPLLTSFDSVDVKNGIDSLVDISAGVLDNKKSLSGSDVVDGFMQTLSQESADIDIKFFASMENDLILKETRGGMPTWIEAVVSISTPGGKIVDKTIPIGVIVKPKKVAMAEMTSFLIKQNNELVKLDASTKARVKKNRFRSITNFKRVSKNKDLVNKSSMNTFAGIMNSVSSVDKPFLSVLISATLRDKLAMNKVDVTKPRVLKHLYDKLPIMSFSIYDLNKDRISYSLTRDSSLTDTTTALFNTSVSQLEKTIAETMRMNKVFN